MFRYKKKEKLAKQRAGAFVNKNTQQSGVYIGTPARRLRDVEPDELESMKN